MGPVSDAAYERVLSWAEGQGLELYPHQEEAILELLSGSNVVLATPTGSGKSLGATAAHMAAMAEARVSFYSAPIKALLSEKFFALCEVFGAEVPRSSVTHAGRRLSNSIGEPSAPRARIAALDECVSDAESGPGCGSTIASTAAE